MVKAAGIIGAVTMVSHVFGLLRDTVIAAFFGAILLIDYFMPWNTYSGFKIRLIYLACTVVAGIGVFFASAYLLKSPESH